MYCVWKAYLEGTVQATQSRISACENYKVQVADPAKMVRLQKEQQLRKVKLTVWNDWKVQRQSLETGCWHLALRYFLNSWKWFKVVEIETPWTSQADPGDSPALIVDRKSFILVEVSVPFK